LTTLTLESRHSKPIALQLKTPRQKSQGSKTT
jgi:hypothetical protein